MCNFRKTIYLLVSTTFSTLMPFEGTPYVLYTRGVQSRFILADSISSQGSKGYEA